MAHCIGFAVDVALCCNLKGLCHEDFAILGQFCAKITT